jgi:hemerythrin-like domain-containing protein
MKPTATLKQEHQVILSVLDAAEREAESIRTSGKVRETVIHQLLDFLRNFADRCHHAKEENILFKKLVERGFPANSGPIWVMLHEHDEGREHLKNIERKLSPALEQDADALADIAESLESYADLLRSHISKEDNALYPMADDLLTPEDQAELEEAFERVEREEMGEGEHERFHALALELTGGTVSRV